MSQGSKRLAAERNLVRTSSVRSPPLIARYGVNAFRHWMGSAADPQASEPAPVNPTKNDVLKMCADELNNKLCGFVREVCRPNGDQYAPDSIFYLCLGIQKVGFFLTFTWQHEFGYHWLPCCRLTVSDCTNYDMTVDQIFCVKCN